ncbi:hypothetical protein FT643_23005 [Ketobacter sp. MCCC 1A13808]|uniref:hypothetical protein n=1 Tax=Ketobacter sp. MCCC 1A13808 TaxID=2602738 RepID=UPI0012EB7013|nr:hypothetical protein [Ketobacter sp. MCCC 1A13808]MVF14997.1 hypothetical protein [Ketobacter sp. MCCC 1A13808]
MSAFNKAVLSPSAGTAIPLALHVSPKPRRYVYNLRMVYEMSKYSRALILLNILVLIIWIFSMLINFAPVRIDAEQYADLTESQIRLLWTLKGSGFQEGYAIGMTFFSFGVLVLVLNTVHLCIRSRVLEGHL